MIVPNVLGDPCWEQKRISEVINREAVEMDEASFLATHTPLLDLRYENNEYEMRDVSENGLLFELQERADSDRHSFVVLKGVPGTGKSHLIRWLKEHYARYSAENGDTEKVLLIKRTNSSLSNTLRQIIEAKLFDAPIFENYLNRLKHAAGRLQDAELDNLILNGLQQAALAVRNKSYELPSDKKFSKRIIQDAPEFLQDQVIRAELSQEGRAIKGIAEFLTGTGRNSTEGEEMPQFEAADFEFSNDSLRSLNNDGYEQARNLAAALTSQPEEKGAELAGYLNSLLNYAVSNLTTITVDQLKNMFGELRRQLRREGKNLSLFIEDITSFTGLDAGLIDVLIDQHGADNPEFCRLTSILGITDNYYNERFQDHVRQRVTYLISLNAQQDKIAANLLSNSEIVAEMSARYLNAIRLSQSEVNEWKDNRANPDLLPNACSECPVRKACHAAFGFVSIGKAEIGLFPFNKQALWTMYRQIDSSNTLHTPRALLHNVISYMLGSHSQKLKEGQFPPPPRELALDVVPPTLQKPLQQTIIRKNASNKAMEDRFETLFLFWGNRTVDTVIENGQVSSVGTLTKKVFDAFRLPFFTGEAIEVTPVVASTIISPMEDVPSKETRKLSYAQDIENWRAGGKLENYDKFARELANIASSSVEWEIYGIPKTLVDERITQARFEIQDQAGMARSQPRFYLSRSDELALVLHALDGRINAKNPNQAEIGAQYAIISEWLIKNTEAIVSYVQQSNEDSESKLPYDEILLQTTFWLACLGDRLIASKTTSREIFFCLIAFARERESYLFDLSNRTSIRSDEWRSVIKSLGKSGDDIRREFLMAFNCPQGTSNAIRFVDSARAIGYIQAFRDMGFRLELDLSKSKGPAWEKLANVYMNLKQKIETALISEQTSYTDINTEIKTYLGESSSKEVFAEIDNFEEYTKANPFTFSHPNEQGLTALKLQRRLEEYEKLQAMQDIASLGAWLSGAFSLKEELSQYRSYFKTLSEHLSKQAQLIGQDLQSSESYDAAVKRQEIIDTYENMLTTARQLLGEDLGDAN